MEENKPKRILTDRQGNQRYIQGKLLGSGGFAKCFEATSLADGCVYAAKVIPKKEINEKRKRYKLILEIKLHRSLQHQNIVGFRDVFQDNENVYIILQHCRNSTLKQLIKRRRRLTEFQTRVYVLQMLKATQFIHRHCIIHRDLKLGNILINDYMQLKLCDFGLSTRINYQGEKKRTVCGTPNYIAPEILEEEGHSYESDIWSVGVIIYTLLFGKPPYESNTVQETYENIRNNKYFFPNIDVSDQAKDLIKKILLLDPSKRLSIQEIKEHPFMNPVQEIPKMLPRFTLAIPPTDYNSLKRIHTTKQQADSHERSMNNKSVIIKDGIAQDNSASMSIPQLRFQEMQNAKRIPFVYVYDILKSNENIGYLLSNGAVGVLLEDKTQFVTVAGSSSSFRYIYSKQTVPVKQQLFRDSANIKDQDIKNKYQRLTYFLDFFRLKYGQKKLKKLANCHNPNNTSKSQISSDSVTQKLYLKKYLATPKQTMARLCNGCVQIIFKDGSSFMMNRNDDVCLYYYDSKHREEFIDYDRIEQITDIVVQRKAKRFSNLLKALWQRSNGQQESESGFRHQESQEGYDNYDN